MFAGSGSVHVASISSSTAAARPAVRGGVSSSSRKKRVFVLLDLFAVLFGTKITSSSSRSTRSASSDTSVSQWVLFRLPAPTELLGRGAPTPPSGLRVLRSASELLVGTKLIWRGRGTGNEGTGRRAHCSLSYAAQKRSFSAARLEALSGSAGLSSSAASPASASSASSSASFRRCGGESTSSDSSASVSSASSSMYLHLCRVSSSSSSMFAPSSESSSESLGSSSSCPAACLHLCR